MAFFFFLIPGLVTANNALALALPASIQSSNVRRRPISAIDKRNETLMLGQEQQQHSTLGNNKSIRGSLEQRLQRQKPLR